MDLTEYRNNAAEKARVGDLISLLPESGESVLDIGARDGFISRLLTIHFSKVIALDLEMPTIDHERIQCVKGDITDLHFPDAAFNLVFCAEVLEHIPPQLLAIACREMARVSKSHVLVGVPYKQDIRVGRTTCGACGKISPPWGPVNRFDEGSAVQAVSGICCCQNVVCWRIRQPDKSAFLRPDGRSRKSVWHLFPRGAVCALRRRIDWPEGKKFFSEGAYQSGIYAASRPKAFHQDPSKLDSRVIAKATQLKDQGQITFWPFAQVLSKPP